MPRWRFSGSIIVAVLIVIALAGCEKKSPSAPAQVEVEAPEDTADESHGASITVRGFVLKFFDPDREDQGAVLEVTLDQAVLEASGAYVAQGVEAIIRGDGAEPIRIMAETGHFDEANQVAVMEGDVRVSSSDMEMTLSDVEWVTEERVARSDSPVSYRKGETTLEAGGMRLYPDTNQVRLIGAQGTYVLEREKQQ